MKRVVLCSILFVLAGCGAYAQKFSPQPFSIPAAPPPEILPPFDTLEEQGRYLAVKHFMSYPRPLSPVGDFTLHAMGDEIATYLNLILERRAPLSDEETLRVLDMIHTAFRDPKFIHLCSSRNPENTLALLETLQATATDPFTKESIAAEASFFTTFLEDAAPVLSHLPCNPGPLLEDVDFSIPANDIPPEALIDPPMSTPRPALPPFIQAEFASVSAYMRLPRPLQSGDRYLAALGDHAAFFVYSFMSNTPPLTAAQMLTALDIVHKSFANPMAIQDGAARRPETTMSLLKMLQATADQTVKDRITLETNYLSSEMPKKIYAPWRGLADPPIFLPKP